MSSRDGYVICESYLVKYKNIRSAIHNFGHSFMSDMNYVNDDFVRNELTKIHRKGEDIRIDWISGSFEPENLKSPRIAKSIAYWQNGIPKHFELLNVDSRRLRGASHFGRNTYSR